MNNENGYDYKEKVLVIAGNRVKVSILDLDIKKWKPYHLAVAFFYHIGRSQVSFIEFHSTLKSAKDIIKIMKAEKLPLLWKMINFDLNPKSSLSYYDTKNKIRDLVKRVNQDDCFRDFYRK